MGAENESHEHAHVDRVRVELGEEPHVDGAVLLVALVGEAAEEVARS